MTSEVSILRAYALFSQGKCDAALEMLKNAPKALNTPSGADLAARIRFEQGFADEAKAIWERIHAAFPDFAPATKALETFANPPEEAEESEDEDELPRRAFPIVALLVLFLGIGCAIWGFCRKPETVVQKEVFTNEVERVVNVPVTQFVTSVVERVAFVTNTVSVVQRVVETNVIERVVTNVVEKVVYKEREVAQPNLVAAVAKETTGPSPALSQQDAAQPPRSDSSLPRPMRVSAETSWFDEAVLDLCHRLGLLPEMKMLPNR